jgi:L-alanine-DL-glutamate epimerase-like enolase superfamily enzyme
MLDPFEMKDGFVGLPTEPGLGVRITEEHLRRYAFVPGTGERT